MQYPLISEYIEAIRSAEDNFDKLANLRPVLDNNGNPIMSSGNFAVVFKMRDVSTGRLFAVKCFIKEQEGRGERYAKITEELQFVSSPYILHAQYFDRELFVNTANCNEEEFPVLVMDWVDGQPLDAYLRENLDDEYALQMLAYRFCNMGAWLLSQPFAHGDLKPDNILVRDDGSLVLVDYDGMYVPSMKGEKAYEIGSPDFRHPQRTADDFDEHIDDFSISSIALSLKAISIDSSQYGIYSEADRLLFSEKDYLDISQSIALQNILTLTSNKELATILSLFLLAISKRDLSMVSFRLLIIKEPENTLEELLSSEITDEERMEAVVDDFGAIYTKDGLKLIKGPSNTMVYSVKLGTKVIGDYAFSYNKTLKHITLPKGIISIGEGAFWGCHNVQTIDLSNTVKHIKDSAFSACYSLSTIELPNSVIYIGRSAFSSCSSIQSITIPKSVKYLGNLAFDNCHKLQKVDILGKIKIIEGNTFSQCESLASISLSEGLLIIGNSAFCDCYSLRSINLPQSITKIADFAFSGCNNLNNINLPHGLREIGSCAFSRCKSLNYIEIPSSVLLIGDYAFAGCKSLLSIQLHEGLCDIGKGVFCECENILNILIPNSV